MEQTPRTSFIPKQTIGVAKTRERRSFNVFTFLAMVVFLSVLTLSIGVFFYKEHIRTALEKEKALLADFNARFDSSAADDIREIRLLENRFASADYLLDQHLAISELFEALEERVQENAQISSFKFERRESGTAQVVLEGKALAFNTVALQKRELLKDSSFEKGSIIFSDIDISKSSEEEGGEGGDAEMEIITFSVTADLDPEVLAYQGVVPTSSSTTTASSSIDVATTTEADPEPETP